MPATSNGHLARPRYLRIPDGMGATQTISLREHLSPDRYLDRVRPLVLLTLHPGYAAGSYGERDYFELLAPLLFQACWGRCRLRILTVNHAGYDLPPGEQIDRFDLAPFSMWRQPDVIRRVLRHVLEHDFREEERIHLVALGHSMGGLALAQCDLQQLARDAARSGRQLTVQKILSAPAFILSREAKKNMDRLNVLHTLKQSVGRLPWYGPVAKSLYSRIAPTLYRRDARRYSLNPDCSFADFSQYDPFLLLQQGRELLELDLGLEEIAGILAGSHLLVPTGDDMIDFRRLLLAALLANKNGSTVSVHTIDAPHNAERERPQVIAERLYGLMLKMIGEQDGARLM
jgi:pimeloyl-ACP methyl ester carboxylesterase